MCEAVGKKVQALHRSQIGNIKVNDLKPRWMEIFKEKWNIWVAKIEKT